MIEQTGDSILSRVHRQIYSVFIANCIIFSHGIIMGWLSPALPILLSEDTPLKSGPITNDELSWIGAMNSIGAIVGTFICGIMSALMGSKRAMTWVAYPAIAFWILIYFGDSIGYILLARFCTGLTGGGFQSGVVLYVSEISNDNVRGRLGSVLPLARNSGILIAYVAGALIRYEHRPYVFIFIPVLYLIWVLFLPNTPQYYFRKENYTQAEKSLIFYKGCNPKNERENTALKAEFNRLKLLEEERKRNSKIEMKDICNRLAFKGIITSICMSWFMQTTGAVIIMNYASLIFEISGSLLSVDASGIILAVLQILGGLVSTQLGDTFTRKMTLFISLGGSAIGLFIFTIYSYLPQNGFDISNYLWLPVVSLSFIIFISSAGIVALANTCTVENFPLKIRPLGMIFYSLMLNGVALLGEKFFPILLEVIYMHGFLLFLGINCCLGILYVAFMMEETKGQSIDAINPDKVYPIDKSKINRDFNCLQLKRYYMKCCSLLLIK